MRSLTKSDLFVHNDFIEGLVEDPESVSKYTKNSTNPFIDNYMILFESAIRSIRGYKIFDYILLQSSLSGYLGDFELDLYEESIYYDYIDSVISREDKFLKAFLYTYLTPEELDETYKDKMKVAKDLVHEGNYSVDYRTNALIKLLDMSLDDKLVNYVEESITKLLREDAVVRTMRTDEEIECYINLFKNQIKEKKEGKRLELEFVKSNNG